MSFQFIDNNSTPDRATRTLIRRQAATGRNAGRTVVRTSRKKLLLEPRAKPFQAPQLVKSAPEVKQEEREERELEEVKRLVPKFSWQWQFDSGLKFPAEISPNSMGLVRKAFHFLSGPRHIPEMNNALIVAGRPAPIWVTYMLVDEAYFHCVMATAITILNNMIILDMDPTTECMNHLCQSFRILNERLSSQDADAISDQTIGVVVGLAQYERHQKQFDRGIIHLRGLQRMVQMRGGISKLTKHLSSLTHKIFRADLEYSFQLGSRTIFNVDDVIDGIPPDLEFVDTFMGRNDDQYLLPSVSDLPFLGRLGLTLKVLFLDARRMAKFINAASANLGPKLDTYSLSDIVLLLGFRLIKLSPLGEARPSSSLENAVHLGLVAYDMTFLPGLDRKTAGNPLLAQLARSAAMELLDADQESKEVLLWLLFIGGVSVFRQKDHEWMLPKVSDTMKALDVRTWDEVKAILLKFPWVHDVHDRPAMKLWDLASSNLELLEWLRL